MSSLGLPRTALEWRYLPRQAISWWLLELAALAPKGRRRSLTTSRSGELVLRYGLEQAALSVSSPPGCGPNVMPVRIRPESSSRGAWDGNSGRTVRIILEDHLLFRCAIELPASAEATINPILQHQLERLLPLDPSGLVFTWYISERLQSRNALIVTLTLARRHTLDQALAYAKELGLRPREIQVDHKNGSLATLWRGRRADNADRVFWLKRAIEAAILVLCVAAYCVDIVRLDSEITALKRKLEPAQARLLIVDQFSRQLAETQSTLALIKARLATATPLAMLDELTLRLPLDTYLLEFDYRPDRVSLVGTTSHATALLARLNQSPVFYEPQFTAPITKAPEANGEHFELALRLRGQKP